MEKHQQIRKLIRENIENFIKDSEHPLFDIFNQKHTYGDKVKDSLVNIIMNEEGISEKSFGLVDEAINKAKFLIKSEEIQNLIKESEVDDKRAEYCAESIFYEHYVLDLEETIDEGKKRKRKAKNKFQKLKDNKVPLNDEERAEVMKKKAVWHHGPNGEETPAVWKSKDKDGKITYICHTHRAYNTASSLGAAINKFHNFIKGTA